MSLKPSKCHFVRRSVNLLGYAVSEKGIFSNPDNTDAIRRLPTPAKLTESRTFLGMARYYQKIFPQLTEKAYPLVNLIRKNTAWF